MNKLLLLISRMTTSLRWFSISSSNLTTIRTFHQAPLNNNNNNNNNNNYGRRFGGRRCYCSSLLQVQAAAAAGNEDKKNNSFFVVRKGDLVGVYNNLIDCQAQLGSSVCDPPVSVYKGYALPKDTEAYLRSYGLQNALYSIRAADLTDNLFGTLIPCPFQHPLVDEPETTFLQVFGSQTGNACILEFDGACKGNPGQSGAGAVLRAPDGSLIYRLREGLGVATNMLQNIEP